MSLRLHPRAFPPGVIPPCLPTAATEAPSGDGWLHEIKHDGYRVLARKDGQRIKLFSRSGNELTNRFPLIVEAMAKLRSHSCIIDGEAVACGPDGIACFELIRGWDIEASVFMWAFDLIELDGQDMRHNPLETRKASLECLLSRAAPGLPSISTSQATARSSSSMLVGLGLKGSSPSARTRAIPRGDRYTGLNRTERAGCEGVRLRRIGVAE